MAGASSGQRAGTGALCWPVSHACLALAGNTGCQQPCCGCWLAESPSPSWWCPGRSVKGRWQASASSPPASQASRTKPAVQATTGSGSMMLLCSQHLPWCNGCTPKLSMVGPSQTVSRLLCLVKDLPFQMQEMCCGWLLQCFLLCYTCQCYTWQVTAQSYRC